MTRTDNGVVKQQSVTKPDVQTWQRGIHRTREGGTVGREVTVTNPQGGIRTFTESVTVDPPAPAGN